MYKKSDGFVGADYERASALVAEKLSAHSVVHIADRADADGDEVSDDDI